MAAIRWTKDSILGFINSHIVDYPTPVNLNYFGVLVLQQEFVLLFKF